MHQGISLPPQVQGSSIKGDLDLIFGSLKWTSTSKRRPQHLFARIVWWGDESATTHDIPLFYSRDTQTNANSSIQFPLVSSAAHIARYLNDLAVLEINFLQVEASPKAIAKVSINTAAIANTGLATFNDTVMVIALQTGAVLGSLQIKFDINYRPPARSGYSVPAAMIKSRESVGQEVAAALESLKKSTESAMAEKERPLLENSPAATASTTITEQQNPVMEFEQSIHKIDASGGIEPPLPTSRATEERQKEEEKDDVVAVAAPKVKAQDDGKMQTTSQHGQHSVLVRVDSAFELLPPSQKHANSMPASAQSKNSLVYASLVWQRDRSQRVHTHLTGSQEVPLALETSAPTAQNEQHQRHAAVWKSELELKVNIEPFVAAATEFSGNKNNSTGLLDGPLLLINVWRSGMMPNSDPVAMLEQLHLASASSTKKEAAVSTPFDQLIGCAAVDLSSFVHQKEPTKRQIEGRFPLISAQHQVQGVVKACVIPNSPLAAALDDLIPPKSASEVADREFNFTQSENMFQQSQLGGRKQEYAWSGSDSDDEGEAMAMLGVTFEGAVSCSDGDDVDGDGGEYLNGHRADSMDIEGEEKKAPQGLINQDWMFDICKNIGNQEKEEGDDGNGGGSGGGNVGFHFYQQQQQEEEHEEEMVFKEKKPVVFKNRLLPGVIMSSREVTYLSASDFAESGTRILDLGNDILGGENGVAPPAPPTYQVAALPYLPQHQQQHQQQQQCPSLPPQTTRISHHHPGLNGDWLFGIQQQQEQAQSQQSQHGRPPPPEVTANQFAPMANLPK
ncbi:hypothetical protein Ndes2526B_g04849 [Nannochloris sp. 'desiccata']